MVVCYRGIFLAQLSSEASVVSFFLLSSRLRRGQMKEASEMKYGDQVEGVCIARSLLIMCSFIVKMT